MHLSKFWTRPDTWTNDKFYYANIFKVFFIAFNPSVPGGPRVDVFRLFLFEKRFPVNDFSMKTKINVK